MKINQTINTIINNITFIIEKRQRNFTNFTSSNFMRFTLNYFHFISNKIFIKKNINIFFMFYIFKNVFIDIFSFVNFFITYILIFLLK